MNPEIKDRWVRALRSGDYNQTSFRLSDENGDCCLGVLCKIAEQDQVVFASVSSGDSSYGVTYHSKIDADDRDNAVPPTAVASWAGLSDANPYVDIPVSMFDPDGAPIAVTSDGNTARTSLADLNDTYKFTFDQIADIIEANL